MHRRMVKRMKTMAVCIVLCIVATQHIGLQAFAWKIKLSREAIDDHNLKYDRIQISSQGGIKRCASDALEVWVHRNYQWKTANTKLAPNSCDHVLGVHNIYLQFLNKKFGIAYKKKLILFILPPHGSDIGGYVIKGEKVIYILYLPFGLPIIHLHELTHLYQMELNLQFFYYRDKMIFDSKSSFFIEGLARFAEWEFREQFDFKKEKVYFQDVPANYNIKEYFFPIELYTPTELYKSLNSKPTFSNSGVTTKLIKKSLNEMMVGFHNFDSSFSYSYAFLVFYYFDQLARKRNKDFKIHKEFFSMISGMQSKGVLHKINFIRKSFEADAAKNLFEQMTRKHLGMSFAAFEKSFQSNVPHIIRNLRMK